MLYQASSRCDVRLCVQVTETGAQVLIIASCSDAGKLPKLLRATGRLDHLIEVGTPNTAERRGMIEHMLRLRGLSHDASALEGVARRMEGFDAADLAVVIERAAQQVRLEALAPAGARRGAAVDAAHWDAALAHFQPSAAWEAGAQETADARCAPPATAVCLPHRAGWGQPHDMWVLMRAVHSPAADLASRTVHAERQVDAASVRVTEARQGFAAHCLCKFRHAVGVGTGMAG